LLGATICCEHYAAAKDLFAKASHAFIFANIRRFLPLSRHQISLFGTRGKKFLSHRAPRLRHDTARLRRHGSARQRNKA
jgi:hypothetical protein